MFIRLGTPMGLRMMSMGVPSGRCGMSSTGRIRAITPLFPCRPAILSPSAILRRWAIATRPIACTPAGIVVRPGEEARVDHLAALPVRHPQGGILHLAGLLSEDGAQELLFRGELGLALWRDLSD